MIIYDLRAVCVCLRSATTYSIARLIAFTAYRLIARNASFSSPQDLHIQLQLSAFINRFNLYW